jgi:hypothetical protein
MLLFFLARLLQAYPSTLLAAQNASGRLSTSFYLSKVDGLPSGQKLNLRMRHYRLSWGNYRPQEVWEDGYAERCFSAGKCEAATHAGIWLDKGDAKTSVFQENTMSISAGSVLKVNSSLNIENKIRFVNELGQVLI